MALYVPSNDPNRGRHARIVVMAQAVPYRYLSFTRMWHICQQKIFERWLPNIVGVHICTYFKRRTFKFAITHHIHTGLCNLRKIELQ